MRVPTRRSMPLTMPPSCSTRAYHSSVPETLYVRPCPQAARGSPQATCSGAPLQRRGRPRKPSCRFPAQRFPLAWPPSLVAGSSFAIRQNPSPSGRSKHRTWGQKWEGMSCRDFGQMAFFCWSGGHFSGEGLPPELGAGCRERLMPEARFPRAPYTGSSVSEKTSSRHKPVNRDTLDPLDPIQ